MAVRELGEPRTQRWLRALWAAHAFAPLAARAPARTCASTSLAQGPSLRHLERLDGKDDAQAKSPLRVKRVFWACTQSPDMAPSSANPEKFEIGGARVPTTKQSGCFRAMPSDYPIPSPNCSTPSNMRRNSGFGTAHLVRYVSKKPSQAERSLVRTGIIDCGIPKHETRATC